MDFIIDKIEKDYPYNLLLLADETVEAINKYLYDSDVYIVKNAGETIGVFCLFSIDNQTVEIKNVAVSEKHQGKGVGRLIMKNIEKISKEEWFEIVSITKQSLWAQQSAE